MKKFLLTAIIFVAALTAAYSQCTKPSHVIIAQSPTLTICQGNSVPLIGNVTVMGASQNGGFTYSWIKTAGAGTGVKVVPTSITILANAAVGIPVYTGIVGSILDAGTYTLRVEDGSAGNAACYTEASVVVNVTAPVLPGIISADQTICTGSIPATITGTASTGGTAFKYYKWQRSTSGAIGPWIQAAPYSSTATYLPAPLISDTYFRRIDSSGLCAPAPTNVIKITINPIPSFSVTIAADKSAICNGTLVAHTATVTGAGATPAPSYQWFITSAATVGTGVPQGAPSTTATTFVTSALTPTNNKVYVQITSNATCASTNPVTSNVSEISVNTGIGSGTIGSNQTICYNTVPAEITQLIPPTNIIATPVYQWEVSSDNITAFTTITGATNTTYTPTTPLTQDVYIRRVTTDPGNPAPCNVAYSNVVHIIVTPQLTAGIIGSDQTICSGSPTSTITQTTAPLGGATYIYQWEASVDGFLFTPIAGATNSSYNAGALTATTYFRKKENSTCGTTYSNAVVKTIVAPEVVTAVIDNFPTQVCAGMTITFTANGSSTTGTGTLSYQWYLGTTPVGTNSPTYNYLSVIGDDGKVVKVVVTTSTGCNAGPATSTPFIVDIVNAITPTISISGNPVNCEFLQTTFTATSTGGGSAPGPVYQWYVVPSGSGPPVAVGTGGTAFGSSTLHNGDKVYVELTSSAICLAAGLTNPTRSNEIRMDIRPIPHPVIIGGDQTICAPNTFTYTAAVGTGTILQWYNQFNAISGATNSTFTASQSGAYFLYEDNGVCNSTSAPAILTVDPCGAFSSNITGPNPITSGQQNAVYSVTNQTGFTYTWSITGGTIVSGQNTNAVTVDWDAPVTNSFARTTAASYSISVLEKNPTNQTKTTTATINTITTGIALSQAQSGINIFPNPTTGSFNIEMPESGIDVTYEILDLAGRSVGSGTFTSTGNNQNIYADFGAGMYQVVLKYNNVVTCVRLSKVQ